MEWVIDLLIILTIVGIFSMAVFFGVQAFNSVNSGPEFTQPKNDDDL